MRVGGRRTARTGARSPRRLHGPHRDVWPHRGGRSGHRSVGEPARSRTVRGPEVSAGRAAATAGRPRFGATRAPRPVDRSRRHACARPNADRVGHHARLRRACQRDGAVVARCACAHHTATRRRCRGGRGGPRQRLVRPHVAAAVSGPSTATGLRPCDASSGSAALCDCSTRASARRTRPPRQASPISRICTVRSATSRGCRSPRCVRTAGRTGRPTCRRDR